MRMLVLLLVLLAVVAAAGLYGLSPLLTLRAYKQDIAERDAAGLEKIVDFEAFRERLIARTHRQVEVRNEGEFLGELQAEAVKWLADGMLKQAATPAGMIGLVCDGDPDAENPTEAGKPCEVAEAELHDYALQSPSRLSIGALREDGIDLTFEFRRDGLRWTIIDIIGPPAA